jgi:porphobilinogen synthase
MHGARMIQEIRPRRNRKNMAIRSMIKETTLLPRNIIAPLFVVDGKGRKEEISSMPGVFRYSVDLLLKEVKELFDLGIPCVSLFPAFDDSLKDPLGTESFNPDSFYQKAIYEIKALIPEMLVMTDVALDPYSSDGHDGVVDKKTGEILNDQTLEILAKMAITQATSGADIIGPSDMMDGRVGVIRKALEVEGFSNTLIMSYTAKYASSFYGPFRDALDSAPKSGDKKTYQMDYCNRKEALREMRLDEKEGADILMVKPGLAYLDVIRDLKENSDLPIAAYNVSGEYAMVMAASEKGWLDHNLVMLEMLTSFRRAGADMILTYFAKSFAKIIQS